MRKSSSLFGVLVCHLEKSNAASKAKHEKARPGSKWEKECEAKRRELGMSMTEEPWIGRPAILPRNVGTAQHAKLLARDAQLEVEDVVRQGGPRPRQNEACAFGLVDGRSPNFPPPGQARAHHTALIEPALLALGRPCLSPDRDGEAHGMARGCQDGHAQHSSTRLAC